MSSANPPFTLRVVEQIDSTNAELLRLPLEQAPPGSALLALRQSQGRGRSDRRWESAPGGMYLSVMLRPSCPQGLALLGARALLDLLDSWGMQGTLRWPNDVMIAGRKLGGVLPVARYQGNSLERAVLGVGVNVLQTQADFPAELRGHVTSLVQQSPRSQWDVVETAQRYLRALETALAALEEQGLAAFCASCEPYLEGLEQSGRTPVLVEPGQPDRALPPIVGLSAEGALLLAGGEVLSQLGRDQRLRFADEL
jgi:biotin-[acetyl-CoA-carboxylase] ligase BirA-like protein